MLIFAEERKIERNKTKLQAASLNWLIRGAFHSTKSSEIFKTEKNGREISWERFQKIRKCLNFRKANHSTKNYGNYRMKIKWNGNFEENVYQNLGNPQEVVLFFGNYVNSQFSIQRSFFWGGSQRVGHPTQRLRHAVVRFVNGRCHLHDTVFSTKSKKRIFVSSHSVSCPESSSVS